MFVPLVMPFLIISLLGMFFFLIPPNLPKNMSTALYKKEIAVKFTTPLVLSQLYGFISVIRLVLRNCGAQS